MNKRIVVSFVGMFSWLAVAAPVAQQPHQSGVEVPVREDLSTIDCKALYAKGLAKQVNMRAGLLREICGDPAGAGKALRYAAPSLGGVISLPPSIRALAIGGADVNVITGGETYPHVTQSEAMVWGEGNTIVVNYNDSRTAPSSYSGVSYSTDGGTTFTRILPSPFSSHGTNYGDPIVIYNKKLGKWFAGDLATGCGGQGIGLWTSTDGVTWATGSCAHNGSADDRESLWVDNNSSSPYYGRMYISWNDFAAGQGIYCVYSDNGTTWTKSTVVGSFIRNVQITGSKGTDGAVFIAGMNEGGGGGANRTNIMYRSTNGGSSWTQITMGSSFGAPGQTCPGGGYFYMIPPIWRHMGWGQPGVGPSSVVHYDYCGRGVNSGDSADVYYTRSADNGTTWSTPIVLNSDQASGGTQAQWMPSLTVTPGGTVLATWYDRRNTTNGTNYEYWGRISTDNGQTWLADEPISDVVITQPAQPDSSVQSCYAGDYNYITTQGAEGYVVWTDGRNQVSGVNQQDVYFDKVAFCPAITLSPSSLPNGTVGTSYSQTFGASGGTTPYTYAVTAGSPPSGLALSTGGVLSGTPTAPGASSFTVTATDAIGCTGSQPYTLTIDCAALTIAPPTLPDAILGASYTQNLTASGGTAPYSFSVTAGTLPPGLLLAPWGTIQGTPTAVGGYNFTVGVTDAASCTGSKSYSLDVRQKIDFIVGTGLGKPNANQVRVFDATGTQTSVNFFAYAANKWGVNVAGGDIDGGLYAEILTGPGPGDVFGPQVRGFSRAGKGLTKVNFFAYGTLRYGVNVAGANLDSDAFSEILTGAGPGAVFGPHVRGWNYDGGNVSGLNKLSFFAYRTLKYGVNVSRGDVDADGFDEILSGPGPSPAFAPNVRGFDYDGSTVTAIGGITFNAFTVTGYGVNVASGDFDGDGFDEIAATPGPSASYPSQFRGFNYDGGSISGLAGFNITPFATKYGGRVGDGNVDGAVGDDLLTGAGRDPSADSKVKAFQYGSGKLTLIPGQFTPFGAAHYGVNVAASALGY